MLIRKAEIEDILVIENKKFGDERGWFSEVFRQNEFEKFAGKQTFVQYNESFSGSGILRGIHFQDPNPQGKLVRVVIGEVFDVAVDLRKGSQTYGKWFGTTLSAENGKQLWIPEGFGHGFYVTGECAHFIYQCTNYYDPSSEHCIKYDDRDLNIDWPLHCNKPLVSDKDLNGIAFADY